MQFPNELPILTLTSLCPFDRGRIPQSTQDILAKIHGLIKYWELKEATTIIELAIWKSNIKKKNEGIETTRQKLIRTHRGRETRAIMSDVLSSLVKLEAHPKTLRK